MALKSLDQFNAEKLGGFKPPESIPNGIACPQCGAECQDTPGITLASNPPRVPITCTKCSFASSRVS